MATATETRSRERMACGHAELREDSGAPPKIVGYASVFDRAADIGTFDEIVRPGAFARAVREKQDVRALINHDANHVLGRSSAGTLRMMEDDTGLKVEIDPPDTQAARDLMESMRRGDVSQMSFAFIPAEGGERVSRDKGTGRRLRELLDVDLFDVSVVTYPAYEETSAAVRSIERADAEERDRARERLGMRLRISRLSLTRKG